MVVDDVDDNIDDKNIDDADDVEVDDNADDNVDDVWQWSHIYSGSVHHQIIVQKPPSKTTILQSCQGRRPFFNHWEALSESSSA